MNKMYLTKVIFNITKRNIANPAILNSLKFQCKLYSYHKGTVTSKIPLEILRYSSVCPPKCWNCSFAYKSELFCSKCKVLQELPGDLTYFEIIGVKKEYSVENEEIHKKYRELQKMLHPDKFGNKSEKEKEISGKLSTLVNKAYSTLIDPLKRGIYMLKLHNISIPEGTTNLNPEFLMEIMEKNEEIEAAANDKNKIIDLIQKNKAVLHELSNEVANAFREKNMEKAKEILIKMKYYNSIEQRLKNMKDDLGIVQ